MTLQMEDTLAADITELGRFDPVERDLSRTKAVQPIKPVASRAWIAARSSQLRRLISIGSAMRAWMRKQVGEVELYQLCWRQSKPRGRC
jgi:hypothetical protein